MKKGSNPGPPIGIKRPSPPPAPPKIKSRAEVAGEIQGQAIVEMVNLMYQNNTAKNFWYGLMAVLNRNERK